MNLYINTTHVSAFLLPKLWCCIESTASHLPALVFVCAHQIIRNIYYLYVVP